MKQIKAILITVLIASLIITSFAINTSADVEYGTIKFEKDKGLVITFKAEVPVTTIKLGNTILEENKDYTVSTSGNTVITFTEDFMANTLVKDVKSIEVYNGATKYGLGSSNFETIVPDGEAYVTAQTRAAFDDTSSGYFYNDVLNFFVEKGVLTKTLRDDGTTVYKHGNLEVLYVDDEYAYPAEVNYFDCFYSYDMSFEDAYCFFMKDARYYAYSSIYVAFGNRMVMDWSSFKPGVETKLDFDYNTRIFIYNNIVNLLACGAIYYDEVSFESTVDETVYDSTMTKPLFDYRVDPDTMDIYITVYDGLTYEDNAYFKYADPITEGERDGDYGMLSIVFENPSIKAGDKSSWNSNDKGNLAISSYAEIEDYLCIYVDGGQISKDAFTVTEGSTVITLKEAFLEKLSSGSHTLEIVSTIGSAKAGFDTTIVEEKKEETKTQETKKTSTEETKEETIANTADSNMIGAFIALSTLSALGFVSLKKKEN